LELTQIPSHSQSNRLCFEDFVFENNPDQLPKATDKA